MSKIAEEVKKLVAPIVDSFGCELVEVEFAKKHNGEELEELSIEEIRSISKTLFKESNEEVKIKYN